jgi:membrane protease YdiL (CAAX protease family)
VAWALTRLGRSPLTPVLAWVAIVIAALAFGAGHLPAAAQVWPLDAVVIVRTVLLNGVGGLVFGWLFWKHGLAPAMLAHFGADLVLHVLAPLAMA